MPGHFIALHCFCGFEGEGAPGAHSLESDVHVMAYSSSKAIPINISNHMSKIGEEEPIVTIAASVARERGLAVLEDPALLADPCSNNRFGPWCGYRCPMCLQSSMSLTLVGHWD